MEICLVRHGETDWNRLGKLQGHTDIELNATGLCQAHACAEALMQLPYELVITSPLKRAKQTATIIANKKALPIVEMPQFIERNYGDAEGLMPEERAMKFPDLNYPNQESREALTQRVLLGLEQIRLQFHAQRLIVVAHGAVINSILAALSQNEIGSGKTKLKNACLSMIHYVENHWEIINYNMDTHLNVASSH
jgi:uncharacterized phosphatase